MPPSKSTRCTSPAVAADVDPAVFVYLNLSRDQLDRVGEIGAVERRLREGASAHPDAVVVANCDDPLIASAAADIRTSCGSQPVEDGVVTLPRIRAVGVLSAPVTTGI